MIPRGRIAGNHAVDASPCALAVRHVEEDIPRSATRLLAFVIPSGNDPVVQVDAQSVAFATERPVFVRVFGFRLENLLIDLSWWSKHVYQHAVLTADPRTTGGNPSSYGFAVLAYEGVPPFAFEPFLIREDPFLLRLTRVLETFTFGPLQGLDALPLSILFRQNTLLLRVNALLVCLLFGIHATLLGLMRLKSANFVRVTLPLL